MIKFGGKDEICAAAVNTFNTICQLRIVMDTTSSTGKLSDDEADADEYETQQHEKRKHCKRLVAKWGLKEYYDKLINEGYDNSVYWKFLEKQQLLMFGFKSGHAVIFMEEIKRLNNNNSKIASSIFKDTNYKKKR